MNKEKVKVKEIIVSIQNHLDKYEERFKNGAVDSTVYYLYCDDERTLLDYITNLQEENIKLRKTINNVKEKVNQYEFISGYYDDNYDGEDTTYSHDTLKEDLLEDIDKLEKY